jgi:hypothetical protein
MELEIVEFYPVKYSPKKNITQPEKFIGTLHIYLPKFGMDIRGIAVFRKAKQFFFKLPSHRYVDDETKVRKTYPIINFIKKEDATLFCDLLKKLGNDYVKKFLKDYKPHDRNSKIQSCQ